MILETNTRRVAASYAGGFAVAAATLAALVPLVWVHAVYRLPIAVGLLLLLLILRERRQRGSRETAMIAAYKAIAEAEASFRGVFESSPDTLCIHRIAPDGTICLERFNPAAGRSRGFDESSYGKTLEELLPPAVFAEAKRDIDRVVATGATARVRAFPGRDHPNSEIVIVPLQTDGASGRVDRVFVNIRDLRHLHDAQAAIAQSEARYRELAESTSDMISRLSLPELRRTYVSPASRTLVGFEPEEMIARDPIADIHPADMEPIKALIGRLSTGDRCEPLPSVSYRVKHKAGHWLWVEASISFTQNAAGVVNGLICSIRDADARRRAEVARADSEARFRLLAENANELIVLGHDDGRRSYISPASTRLVGFTPSELEVEMRSKTWVHPDDVEVLASAILAQSECDTTVACRVRHKCGAWIWVEAIFRRIPSQGDDEPTVVATFRDITERQAQAQALREAKDVADVARSAAEQASQAKSDFLATMSHEIRTPLNAILGFTDLLQDDRSLSTEGRRHLARIRNAGAALRTVVDDILDFSRLEAGEVSLKSSVFCPATLVDNVSAIVRGLAQSRQLDLVVSVEKDVPAFVRGDDDRLRQILVNLLNNAIKFTRQGAVALSLDVAGSTTGLVGLRFKVTDTGIGVPSEKLASIFQRFSQVDGSNSREFGGTGLGLAICRSLVEAMGGTIGVESTVGEGSIFWFDVRLPIADGLPLDLEDGDIPFANEPSLQAGGFDDLVSIVCAAEHKSPRKSSGVSRPLEILLVEDVVLNQELIVAILGQRGHRVDVVGNGAEAIMAVEDRSYDLVLMDIQMPCVDGLTATRRIRSLAGPCRFVPIVALTAAVMQEQRDAALASGMNGVLTKPVVPAELDAVLARAARDEWPEAIDPGAFDEEVADQLVRALGEVKVRSMQALLVKSLTERFVVPLTDDTAAVLKAEAHASIAGAAMLGFVRFGSLCRAFIAADGAAIPPAYEALLRELCHVVRTLQPRPADASEHGQTVYAA